MKAQASALWPTVKTPRGASCDSTTAATPQRTTNKVSVTARSLAIILITLSAVGCTSKSLNAELLTGASWALTAVNGIEEKSNHQTVAVLDGGISPESPLSKHILKTWQADSLKGKTQGVHGDDVAALIAGAETSVHGKVDLLDVRVLDTDGVGEPEDIAEGVLWSVSAGADIISMSLRMADDNKQLKEAVQFAQDSGAVIVASAANDFVESPTYPAEYPGVIGVTSIDRNLQRAPLARSRGADIAVPGQDIQTMNSHGEPAVVSGTSMAAALATSVIAKCLDPNWTSAEIIKFAESSDTKVLFDKRKIPLLRCP